MEPRKIQEEMKLFSRQVGPQADLYVSIDMNGIHPLEASLYADGLLKGITFRVVADEWRELFDLAGERWTEHKDEHRRRMVRKMALEIIQITAEQGECTDSALRAGEFSNADVQLYGPDACADANVIASNGPFEIRSLVGANAA